MRRPPVPTRQTLLWCPPGSSFPEVNELTGMPVGGIPIPYAGPKPVRVWTLYLHTDEKAPPALPYTPVHFRTAFLEDLIHDWNVRGEKLRYYSRATAGGCWLLLEVPA